VGSAITEVVPIAVGMVLANPFPVLAVILLLFSPRGRTTAPAFLIGWVAGLVVALILLLYVVPTERFVGDSEDPSTLASVIRFSLGLLLLGLAVKQWGSRPKTGESATLPGWITSLEEASAATALGIGAALAGINPKNLAFTVAVAVVIAQAHLTTGATAVVILIFVLLGSLGVMGPVLWQVVQQERARTTLMAWRNWLEVNYHTVTAVVFILFGIILASQGAHALLR
jgi:threonine/homoserine/homoserine lactone efflux protein